MDKTPHSASTAFDLQPGAVLDLRQAAGRELTVFSGRLWLTCSGGAQDVFLTAGDRLRLGPDAVIECDSPGAARLQLLPARGPAWWAAATAWRAFARLALRLQGVHTGLPPRLVDRRG